MKNIYYMLNLDSGTTITRNGMETLERWSKHTEQVGLVCDRPCIGAETGDVNASPNTTPGAWHRRWRRLDVWYLAVSDTTKIFTYPDWKHTWLWVACNKKNWGYRTSIKLIYIINMSPAMRFPTIRHFKQCRLPSIKISKRFCLLLK